MWSENSKADVLQGSIPISEAKGGGAWANILSANFIL